MNEKRVLDFFQHCAVSLFLLTKSLVFCLLLFTILVISLLLFSKKPYNERRFSPSPLEIQEV